MSTEKLKYYFKWQDHDCVIVDILWMEQQILTVPVPEKVKIRWETNGNFFEAWVPMNALKGTPHQGEWDADKTNWLD